MQGSVSHPWLEQVEHSGKEFVSLRVRSSVGFPPGRRETSLGRAGAKAIATVLLFGGPRRPRGKPGTGGYRGGCASGRNESVFQSQDKCEEGAPQGLHQGEACPHRCPLGKDRTEQGEGGVASLAGCSRAAQRPRGMSPRRAPCAFQCFLRWKTGRSRHLSGIECA